MVGLLFFKAVETAALVVRNCCTGVSGQFFSGWMSHPRLSVGTSSKYLKNSQALLSASSRFILLSVDEPRCSALSTNSLDELALRLGGAGLAATAWSTRRLVSDRFVSTLPCDLIGCDAPEEDLDEPVVIEPLSADALCCRTARIIRNRSARVHSGVAAQPPSASDR
jgi:hypothetical protein